MLLATVLAAGCEQLPMPRPNVVPIHVPNPAEPATETEKAPRADSVPLSHPAEPLPPLPKEGAANPEESAAATATPLLDEALMQAELVKHLDTSHAEADGEDHHAAEKKEAPKAPSPDAESKPLEVALNTVPTATPPSRDHANASAPIDPEKPTPEPPTPRERWNKGLERLRSLVHERENSPDAASGPWSLRARVLEVLDATGDNDSVDHPTWKAVTTALAVASGRRPADEHSRAVEIREAITTLEDKVPLEITELQLCRKVNGFGNFEPVDSNAFKAGQSLIVYCELSGIRYTQSGEAFRSNLSSRIELVPSQGGAPVWTPALDPAEDYCRHRRRDYFINYRLTIPDNVPAGVYDLKLIQKDEIAGLSTSSSLPVTIIR